MAAEAYSEMGGSPKEEESEALSDTELEDRGTQCKKKKKLPELTKVCSLLFSFSFSFMFLPFGLRLHLQSHLLTHP